MEKDDLVKITVNKDFLTKSLFIAGGVILSIGIIIGIIDGFYVEYRDGGSEIADPNFLSNIPMVIGLLLIIAGFLINRAKNKNIKSSF